jgi:hypothetical protein
LGTERVIVKMSDGARQITHESYVVEVNNDGHVKRRVL